MLDAIRKELALATVEPTGGLRSIAGKTGTPSNDTPQALIVQVAAHLSVRMTALFSSAADAIPLDVPGTTDSVYAIVNPRSADYDTIGEAFTKLRVSAYSKAVATETQASIEICRCGSQEQAKTLARVLGDLAELYKTAGALRLTATGGLVSLTSKFTGNRRGASVVERLDRVGAQIKDYTAGIRVYEGHPTYVVKSQLR